jgi:shikimate kinase
MKRVFLMGMPGSGKTTLGKKLAAKLGLTFIDLDQYIEEKEKKTVQEIFSEQGEDEFRKIETECLSSLISTPCPDDVRSGAALNPTPTSLEAVSRNSELPTPSSQLISLGGGTPCFNNNLELINKNGISVYLQVSALMLADRIKDAKNTRPLFAGLDEKGLQNKITAMLELREHYYKQAALILDGKSVKTDDAAEQIRKLMNR